MKLSSLLSKLNLSYNDQKQEAEYLKVKIPLLKSFLAYLILCLVVLLIPLAINFFFILDLSLQGYVTIGAVIIAILLFVARNYLDRWLEYIVVGYLLCIVALIIFNLSKVLLSFKSCESFYGGYAFALLHRILGYRVVNVYSMIVFHAVSLSMRLVLLYDHNLTVSLIVTAVEIMTLGLSIKSEAGERELFDSLYKSKQQLLKFKDFLTEHLPNQMVIFAKDNSSTYFINDSFKKAFECKETNEAQPALSRLLLEKESVERGSTLFASLDHLSNPREQRITLNTILNLFSKSSCLIKDSEILSFQVCELHPCPEPLVFPDFKDSFAEERELSHTERHPEAPRHKISNGSEALFPKEVMNRFRRRTQTCLMNLANGLESSKLGILGLVEKQKNDSGLHAQSTPGAVKRTFKVKIFLLPWDGKEAIALILDDITQQKTIMELQVADKNKDLVIAMVSHELRTPLNGMLGLIDIIKKKMGADSEITSYLNACRNSGFFLLNLVNSILDLSQIKNNKLKLVYTKFSLIELLLEVKSLFESFCSTKNLYLNLVLGQGVPKTIITDRGRLSQILINLLGNAFKFTFQGGVTIRVEAEANNPLKLRFYIQDTGLGIKKEDQDKLFKLFGRLEQQDKTINTNGVGLGLTISNTLALLLNPIESQGIHVESGIGKGSTFSFLVENEVDEISSDKTNVQDSFESLDEDFPPITPKLCSYKASETFKPNKARTPLKSPGYLEIGDFSSMDTSLFKNSSNRMSSCLPVEQSKKLLDAPTVRPLMTESTPKKNKSWCLIVDDNPFNIIVARHIMEEKGYDIKTAMNGKEAIQEILNHYSGGEVFKLVLMDCQMPIMDGYEATRLLKAMMKKGEITEFPIIALTANNRDEQHERLCQEAGMNGCVSKPLHQGELESVLKNCKKDFAR